MHHVPHDTGWIEVITGCMFSGKTEELIRRLNRATYAKQRVKIFKPRIDARYAPDSVVSHSKQELTAVAVDDAHEILEHAADADVIGIDEAQFFGPPVVGVAERLANEGKRVVVAGLDQDYLGRPFEPMPHLMAVAEYVTKNLAICMLCGNPADRSQRLVRRDATVVVGGTESYEARCRRCFDPALSAPAQAQLFDAAEADA
ncbi:MAG: thymidine kinase [Polyangiaceae bacterium]|nr:thymidine kinase [Polyangiaceae bacterium]MBK8997027.1 thymidine kinase [Myxococcales bacterium]MCE7890270.1 thymidine kinase [Sorangiineae bacterium PRO1]MCL4751206.1 thymidine kinase [Myxococcales bacterium]